MQSVSAFDQLCAPAPGLYLTLHSVVRIMVNLSQKRIRTPKKW
jgi:hypothetical protein